MEKRRQLVEDKKKDKKAKLQAKKQKQDDRFFFQISKNLIGLEPDLIYGSNLVTVFLLPRNKK